PIFIRENVIFSGTATPPGVGLRFSNYFVTHIGNYYGMGPGGPTWASLGGTALQYPNVVNSYYNGPVIDRNNAYVDSAGTHSPDNEGWSATTPAQLTANVPNYDPGPGLYQRWSSSTTVNVTGLVSHLVDGAVREIWNVGSNNIILTNQDGTSSAANRWLTNS